MISSHQNRIVSHLGIATCSIILTSLQDDVIEGLGCGLVVPVVPPSQSPSVPLL